MYDGLRGRSLTSIADLSARDLEAILVTARAVKSRPLDEQPKLPGRNLAMIFEKSSTRTRVSFEVAMEHLGGHALYLSASDTQLGRGETVADTGRVLSGYVDAIMARVFKHSSIEELAAASTVPVINGLSDHSHPCQILADLLTMLEAGADLSNMTVCYVGDANNVTNSLIFASGLLGFRLMVASPPGYQPDPAVIQRAAGLGHSGTVRVEADARSAVVGSDFLYTDVWTSMGQEKEAEDRRRVFADGGYRVDEALLAAAGPQARVLHCLPAHRGEEISDGVVDGPQSLVFPQAENRLHAQKALLLLLLS